MVAYHASKSPSGHKKMHAGLCVLEVKAEMLRESLDSRLGSIIGGASRRVRDALLAPSDDNRCRLCLCRFLHYRQECVDSVNHAIKIGVKDL